MNKDNPYDKRYDSDELYWGKSISKMARRIPDYIRPTESFMPTLIDLGSGEGQNAVFLASLGFSVCALDASLAGLKKTEVQATEVGVEITTIQSNLIGYNLNRKYDVIFSSGALHYLPINVRQEHFEHYKCCTEPSGINVMSVLVEKSFIETAPDAEKDAVLFKSGELMGYYYDWEILYSTEEIFDCNSGGIPHRHAINRIVARR